MTLPDRARKGIVYVFTLSMVFLLGGYGFAPLRFMENWFTDLTVSVRSQQRQVSDQIVLVEINEETLNDLQYRYPVDRAFLADVIKAISKAHPKAIGVDILFDQATEPAKDRQLMNVLEHVEAPLFAAYATVEDGLTTRQQQFLDRFLPEKMRVQVSFQMDDYDSTVRGLQASKQGELPTMAAALTGVNREVEILNLARLVSVWDGPFPRYAAHFVPSIPSEWFANRIVLIGANLPDMDRVNTAWVSLLGPAQGKRAGLEVHAQAVLNLLDDGGYRKAPWYGQWMALLLLLALGAVIPWRAWRIHMKVLSAGMALSVWWLFVYQMAEHSILMWQVTPLTGFVVVIGLSAAWAGRVHLQEKRFIRKAMSHYVAPEVVNALQKNPASLQLGGSNRTVAMLFTDVEGFTSLSSELPAVKVVALLNAYLHGVSTIVADHGGIVDKFIGDGVVALFNAPVDLPDYRARALTAAIQIRRFAQEFSTSQNAQGVDWGRTRIGLLEGDVVVGNMGGKARFDYTAIGDAMNTASRLESANRYVGTDLLFTSHFREHLKPAGQRVIEVGRLVLKGRSEAVAAFSCQPISEQQELVWDEALALAREGEAGQAREKLETLLAQAQKGSEWERTVRHRFNLLERGTFEEPIWLEGK